MKKELLAAAPGQGCFWNGKKTRVSEIGDLKKATVLTTDERFPGLEARRDGYRSSGP